MWNIYRILFIAVIALLLQDRTYAQGELSFYEHSDFQGARSNCFLYYYKQCQPIDFDGASSVMYFSYADTYYYHTFTLYTGPSCDGDWFRQNARIKPLNGWAAPSLAGFNDRLRSYKVERSAYPLDFPDGSGNIPLGSGDKLYYGVCKRE